MLPDHHESDGQVDSTATEDSGDVASVLDGFGVVESPMEAGASEFCRDMVMSCKTKKDAVRVSNMLTKPYVASDGTEWDSKALFLVETFGGYQAWLERREEEYE